MQLIAGHYIEYCVFALFVYRLHNQHIRALIKISNIKLIFLFYVHIGEHIMTFMNRNVRCGRFQDIVQTFRLSGTFV